MYFSRYSCKPKTLDTQLPSHITEKHSLCYLAGPASGKGSQGEHHSSEAGEYQHGGIYNQCRSSATAALLPKVYLEQLSLLLLWLLHINVFVFQPVHKEACLKSVCASAAFPIATGESRHSWCFFLFFFFLFFYLFHPSSLLLS